jgi:hypothetical protein
VVAHLLLQDPAKEAQIVVEAPALDLSSVPSLPAQIDPTPRTDSTVEEVEKICTALSLSPPCVRFLPLTPTLS